MPDCITDRPLLLYLKFSFLLVCDLLIPFPISIKSKDKILIKVKRSFLTVFLLPFFLLFALSWLGIYHNLSIFGLYGLLHNRLDMLGFIKFISRFRVTFYYIWWVWTNTFEQFHRLYLWVTIDLHNSLRAFLYTFLDDVFVD